MNRIHPGKPPSQRRPRSDGDDWRSKLRELTVDLVKKLKEAMEFDDPTARDHVVRAVRLAINEADDPEVEKLFDFAKPQPKDVDDPALVTSAGIYRVVLISTKQDRRDPSAAEAFMAEVVAALDDELGMGWRTKVGKVVAIMVGTMRNSGKTDDLIRRDLVDAALESVGETPSAEMRKTLDFAATGSRPAVRGQGVNPAGMFRLILDNENYSRAEMTTQRFMEVATAEIDRALQA